MATSTATEAPAIEEQARLIKSMKERDVVQFGAVWYPLGFKWWQVWQAYVGYDGGASSGDPPGPIDNTSLAHPDVPGALVKGLAERYDYVLLSARPYQLLEKWYGGGPSFPRKAILRAYQASLDLYPHPCMVRAADEEGEPTGEPVVVLIGRHETSQALLTKACQQLGKHATLSRLWCKVLDADAQYMLANPMAKVEEFAGNDEYTDVLVESRTSTTKYKRLEPLPPVLDADGNVIDMDEWRESLVVGSKLDAQDHEEKWYESVIKEVKPPTFELNVTGAKHDLAGDGDRLLVHFCGWEAKWDAYFVRSSRRLLPLHTKVRNWRDFRATDKVEMKVDGRWHQGQVEEVDREGSRILLRPTDKKEKKTIGDVWFDFESDFLAEAGTHIKRTALTNYYASSYSAYRSHTKGTPEAPGVVGLNNLGNTCFMNSMLQCLSNCRPLTQFFLSDAYKGEINKDNVLGCGGHLAEAYGQHLKDMWSGTHTIVCPSELKKQIGNKAPQFQGYQQQDSQELMSFLMDGLHEDLNRILKKPYVEDTESNGRPDDVVAAEAWDKYKLRNDSIVSDVFGGQLRSHVRCNICDRESITFDAYTSVSVPLPVKDEKSIIFTFLPYDGVPPKRFKAIVPKRGCVGDVMDWFAEHTGFSRQELIVADVYGCKVFRFLSAKRPISEIRDNDIIWMYHVPEGPGAADVKAARAKEAEDRSATRAAGAAASRYHAVAEPAENERDVVVCMMRAEKKNPYYNAAYGGSKTRLDGAADPHLVSVPAAAGGYDRNMTGRQLHEVLFPQMRRFVKDEVAADHDASNPPYTLSIIPKAGYGTSTAVPYTDDEITIAADQMLAADWSIDGYAATFKTTEVTFCEMDASTDVDLTRADGMSLDKCFERFSLREQLGEHDMFYCSACKEHRRAYKQMDLWSVPEVLIVHLKRFQYSQGVYFVHRDKLDNLVEFPLEGLDMSKFIIGPQTDTLYDLFAISNHAGGLGGGHYTAYGKNFDNGAWYDFNDSYVGRADPARLVSRQAYVLFFERRHPAAGK